MKKSLQVISTAKMTRAEWLAMRQNQTEIGGSDFGCVMGVDKYKPAIKLFHQKIGMWPNDFDDTASTYRGRILEDVIAKHYWPYWSPESPTLEECIKNATSGNVMRKCRNVNYVISNKKYPWLKVNLDREICANKYTPAGYLEIKTILGYAANQYEAGVPTSNILQLMGCMAVCENEYGELAQLKDGTFFDVFPMEIKSDLVDSILDKTKVFHDKVVQAKKIMDSDIPYAEKEMMINILAPEPDGTEACEDYLKERFKPENAAQVMQGTDEHKQWAVDYLKANELAKQAKESKTLSGNKLRDCMLENQAQEIDFGTGKVKWGKKSNGHDQFYVSPSLLTI